MTNEPMTNFGSAWRILHTFNGAPGAPTAIGHWKLVIGHCAAALALALGIVAAKPGGAVSAEGAASATARRVVYLFRDALWSADADGAQARALTRGMAVYAYDVTPDGARVAFAAGAWQGDRKRRELVESGVWLVNTNGTGLRRLSVPTAGRGARARVGHLRWSPDGKDLAFDVVGGGSSRAGGGTLYVVHPPDGKATAAVKAPVHSFEWTPEGRIKYRQPIPGEEGLAEWVVTPNGAPPARLPDHPAPPAEAKASPATAHAVATAAPPVPPGAVPQPQPPLEPALSAAAPAHAPRRPADGPGAAGAD